MGSLPTCRFANLLCLGTWSLGLSVACLDGGQTGTEWETPEPPARPATGEGAACDEESEAVPADDDSLGFSADDVIKFALGARETEVAWQPPPRDVAFGPETGVTTLAIEVTPSATSTASVRLVRSKPRDQQGEGARPDIAVQCPPPRLETDAVLRLTSGGGALDEEIPVVLVASDPAFVGVRASVALGSLSGAFSVMPAAGVQVKSLEVRAMFTEFGFAGVLEGAATAEVGGAASQRPLTFGRFPAENPCVEPGDLVRVPVPLMSDSALAKALEKLGAAVEIPLAWDSGGMATLTVEPTATGSACFAANEIGTRVPISLRVRTDDGAIDAELTGALRDAMIVRTPSSPPEAAVLLSATRDCQGDDAIKRALACGIGIDTSGYTSLMVNFSATVPAAPSALTGTLQILGVRPTTCEDTPNSSCGSPGAEAAATGRF